MKKDPFMSDGYCGLYCGSCPQFLAAKRGELPIGQAECHGCKSSTTAGWCTTCYLKDCARKKGIEFCSRCPEYPCASLKEFASHPDFPYHKEIFGSLDAIERRGRDAWLSEMKIRWSCGNCGREASWWDLACGQCEAALNGYAKPIKE
jgi:hypothetical protein